MIKGVGVDIVDIDRIRRIMKDSPRFVDRILTNKEQDQMISMNLPRKIEFVAGRFAAKEAVGKALGIGIGSVSFLDIEISPNSSGRPSVQINQDRFKHFHYHLSISHTEEWAIAYAIVEE